MAAPKIATDTHSRTQPNANAAPNAHRLEHFYYGQVTSGGQPGGEQRLLALSPGIDADTVTDAINTARVPPPTGAGGSGAVNGAPPHAWALVRGGSTPFFLVQAANNPAGQPVRHYIVMPLDTLKSLGGNLSAMRSLAQAQMPAFDSINNRLEPLELPALGSPSAVRQEESILNLLEYTRDRFDTIEALLSALIRNVVIYVHHAPEPTETRVRFIEGLLALLPPPTRFGITFSSYSTPQTPLDAQIRFSTPDPAPPGVLLFDWNTAKVSGNRVEDEYSRYMKSLLRLDIGQVIEATETLTPVAAWRIRRGDDLASALSYASYRQKHDSAVLNNQPVESAEAARILIEDPTLTPDLKAAYIRHLLAFALALDDTDTDAHLLLAAARGQPDLERVIIAGMRSAVDGGKASRAFPLLADWVSDPQGFKGLDWFDLLHRALIGDASARAQANDLDGLRVLLADVQARALALHLDGAAPRLFETIFPVARHDGELARSLIILAATQLDSDKWLRVRGAKALIAQLPPNNLRFFATVTAEAGSSTPPPGLLASAVAEYPAAFRPAMAVRMGEMAAATRHLELLDSEALSALANAAVGLPAQEHEGGARFHHTLIGIARLMMNDQLLAALDANGRRAVLQILLARGAYPELAAEINRQHRLFYPPNQIGQLGAMIRALFAETTIPLSEVGDVLHTLNTRGVKPLPLAMAYLGVLAQFHYSPTLEPQIAELATLVGEHRMLTEAMPPDQLLELVRYYSARRKQPEALRLAALIPMGAARRGAAGLSAMVELYRRLEAANTDAMRAAALDSLRRYIRRLPDQAAPTAITALGKQLGNEVKESLETTLALWQMMNGEAIGDYAYSLHTLAQFLYDTTLPYMNTSIGAALPSMSMLISDLDSLRGGLEPAERVALADALVEFIHLIAAAAGQHRHARQNNARAEAQIDALLAGRGLVSSVVEVFRTMGGYFAQGRRFSVRSEREIREHPLADRAAHLLLREVQQMTRLLQHALLALPPERPVALSAPAIHAEMDSLWKDISLHEQRTLFRDLAVDLQRIAELILIATEKMDSKIVQDDSGLSKKLEAQKQRPENVLEFYRFMAGYFREGKSRG